jgi:hypothetical protein
MLVSWSTIVACLVYCAFSLLTLYYFEMLVRLKNQRIAALEAEVERLKEGRFSEAEFQRLCHNLSGCDRRRFESGCKEYQDQLFGKEG